MKEAAGWERPANLMTARLRLLFVCENSDACSCFQSYLEREGCHLLLATDTRHAVRIVLSACSVDAILIHHDDIGRGSTISSGLRLICPRMPVLLLTAEWPGNGALPFGVDALCYANSLSRRAAHDIAKFVRHLLLKGSRRPFDGPHDSGSRFVSQWPTHLN